MKLVLILSVALLAVVSLSSRAVAAEKKNESKKLKIVFMLGQSEMVGRGELSGVGYMPRKPLVPPRQATLDAHKAMLHQPNGAYLYWQAMNSYDGPAEKKAELKRLIQERVDFKAKFKQQVVDELEKNDGMFRGKKYSKRHGVYKGFWLFNMCDAECETVGLTPKIRAILEAPDNAFNVEAAYDQLIADGDRRYQKQLELNQVLLKGTTPANVAAYGEALKAHGAATATKDMALKDKRLAIAGLAEKHLHLPVAQRTYITALGTVAGAPEGDVGNVAAGKLSIGYGANERSVGLEYAAGLALEQRIDGPILIVKCAWDSRRSIADFWRVPVENKKGPAPATGIAGEPGWAWKRTRAYIQQVLANPGNYHPGYDPKAGFEPVGVIWSQGGYDGANPDYAVQLASLLSDIRKTVKAPGLPVVCATVGRMPFKGASDDHAANAGMRSVAAMPEYTGAVEVMDSYLWRASELGLIRSMIHKRKITPDAAMNETLRSAGEGPFYLLAGHEAGSRLAELIKTVKK